MSLMMHLDYDEQTVLILEYLYNDMKSAVRVDDSLSDRFVTMVGPLRAVVQHAHETVDDTKA